jgi:hypothetical protein
VKELKEKQDEERRKELEKDPNAPEPKVASKKFETYPYSQTLHNHYGQGVEWTQVMRQAIHCTYEFLSDYKRNYETKDPFKGGKKRITEEKKK